MNEITEVEKNESGAACILIAYHADCLDGFTAAWVTRKFSQTSANPCFLLPMEYNKESNEKLLNLIELNEYIRLYVVDFSLSIPMLVLLRKVKPDMQIVILDHHKTAFENYIPELKVEVESRVSIIVEGAKILLDNNKSGASLCWDYFTSFQPTNVPALVRYVEDRDLWRFEYPETKAINKYLMTLPKTLEVWDTVADQLDNEVSKEYIIKEGEYLLNSHNMKVGAIVAKAADIDIRGAVGLAVACTREFSSDVGNELAKLSGTYGACYSLNFHKNKINWSLRSIGDYDVSAIAKKLGGGGHKNAAGFETALLGEGKGVVGGNKDE